MGEDSLLQKRQQTYYEHSNSPIQKVLNKPVKLLTKAN